MINDQPDVKKLDTFMKDVMSSSIPLPKELPPPEVVKPDINGLKRSVWGSKSNQLLADYKYGENLALYGENDATTQAFFKRLSTSLCAIISNEHQKCGTGAESLKPYYTILENCLSLMAKEIDKKGLKDYNITSIIAAVDGFITNYNQRKEK